MPQKGGIHVSGASGCAFIPSLVVTDGRRDRRIITKFFYNDAEYKKESDILLKVRIADPQERIMKTQLPDDIKAAKIDISKIFLPADKVPANEFERNGILCKNVPQDLESAKKYFNDMPYLQYVYAGTDLSRLLTAQPVTFEMSKRVLIGLSNFLKELKRINSRGYFHKDIHSGNITYSETDGRCYLIDFGMFEKNDKISTSNCLNDLILFIPTVNHVIDLMKSNQSREAIHAFPKTNFDVLELFSRAIYPSLREMTNTVIRTDPPSSDPTICQTAYDKIITQFDAFVANYTKKYGGKTKKKNQKKHKTLRRRKVGGNVH